MESDHALSDLVQLFWQIRKTMQTSIQQAYPDRPRSELAMLERLHYIIRQNGQDGAVPVSALPDCLRMLAPAVSRTLRQLEENGLVERIPDPGDHRKALVRLTDKGEAIRLKAEDRMREYMHRVIDRVGEETFARMLDDLSTWEQAMQAELAREE
ncbi:MarR family winged helix-turn-helix transcriptional regulator [uncultured Gemmiger sp.]|uniref:MarR family winged helix-turn-helix transcriptional regulator n=1 Tax=uncultured Gemmiger sp. TaxID=1623490 RepID=UPI0025E3102E|nr:MarR family transcriptional regulator [uncultured Gemmiger sp.]